MSEPDSRGDDVQQDSLIINEVQLLLSEKRTSFSTLRIGIAIFAFPLSVLSVLIATSRQYEPKDVLPFLVPLAIINVVLIALGSYLIVHSIRRARHYDRLILELKRQHTRLAALLD
jgi:Kef-type K+ transport system membrane component KefB